MALPLFILRAGRRADTFYFMTESRKLRSVEVCLSGAIVKRTHTDEGHLNFTLPLYFFLHIL